MQIKSFNKKDMLNILESNREKGISDSDSLMQLNKECNNPSNAPELIAKTMSNKDIEKHSKLINGLTILFLIIGLLTIFNLVTSQYHGSEIIGSIISLALTAYSIFLLRTNNIHEGLLLMGIRCLGGIILLSNGNGDNLFSIEFIFLIVLLGVVYFSLNKLFPNLSVYGNIKKDSSGNPIFPH